MNKQDMTRVLSRHGDFLCVNEIAEIMRLDRGTIRQILFGVPFIKIGRKKMYAVADVAERIWERRTV